MSQWDEFAAAHLQAVVSNLRERKIDQLLQQQVRMVWLRNVDAYDHQLGDTPLSLGITCSENLRELVQRECAEADSDWTRSGVAASVADRSLRLAVAGQRVGLMKAPPATSRTPEWTDAAFRWEQHSDVRHLAAQRNTSAYAPSGSHQHERQLAMPFSSDHASPAHMRDLLVVWSGQRDPALTAGWIGLPCLAQPNWFALEQLWWDEAAADRTRQIADDTAPAAGNFDGLPLPHAAVRLKQGRRHQSPPTAPTP